MPIEPRPLRSALFIPGNRERWLDRIPTIGADSYILDLEDSVPEAERTEARKLVRAALDRFGGDYTLFVRLNGPDTAHLLDDLEAVVCPGLYGVLLSKTRGPADVTTLDALLGWIEPRTGTPVGKVIILPLLETAIGIRLAYEVAIASPRVAHMGASAARGGDVDHALGLEWTPEGLESLYLRSKVLLDVRAAGIQYPITALWTDIKDLEGLRRFCLQARQLGYMGMKAIHPDHLPIIHEVFSPTAEEIAHWEELIGLLEEAEKNGTTAIIFKGQMVDTAMVKTGRQRLALARAIQPVT
jgi:citrate lyase subunit beta / citryl-CoA lyase